VGSVSSGDSEALAATEVHLLQDADHQSVLRRPVLDRLVEYLQSDLAKVADDSRSRT
jgi:hypothetical protein